MTSVTRSGPFRLHRLSGSAGRARGILLVGLALVSLCVLWPLAVGPSAVPREITLVARGMSFYVDGTDRANPVLQLTAGETVRVVLRNEDNGIAHNFEVGVWDVAVARLKGGDSGSVVIDVPNRPDRFRYVCAAHAEMMNGIVEVVVAS